ncbi:unnamed protein product [Ceutorhynchus assimilis]|uniref:DALR anticodon binding domain-containing protein n=1 Tax=Ceutorhynchus assimilis TaxID=467358 RepID=A0A9N9QMY2_9CUCU|nr:unnamed protein product [Ceutorhynchus assimilis]
MNPLHQLINNIYDTLIGKIPGDDETLVKMHTRHLEELGELSFPLPMKNWYNLAGNLIDNQQSVTIFSCEMQEDDIDTALVKFKSSFNDKTKIRICKVIRTSVHLFLERPSLFNCGIRIALNEADSYGKWAIFSKCIKIDTNLDISNVEDLDLTTLRLSIIKKTLDNFLELTTDMQSNEILHVNLSHNSGHNNNILCGPVTNNQGTKDTTNKAIDIFNKRISDMRLMAQHRYRLNIKSASEWQDFFNRLGRASVTIELLSNKPHKSIKIALNDLSGVNKGAAFIFYNCARLTILLKEFNSKSNKGIYPGLPNLDNIDFSLLDQPEEWELLYVYILQYPFVVKNCVRSIEKGIVNPQNLVTFLSSISSVFSVYYRRVRILTEPRDHMFGLVFARIYLLKALQVVFYNALRLLNIEPVSEM